MPFKESKVCRKIFESGWLKNAAFILIHSSAQTRTLASAAMLFALLSTPSAKESGYFHKAPFTRMIV